MYITKKCPQFNQYFFVGGMLDYHIQSTGSNKELSTINLSGFSSVSSQVGSGPLKLLHTDTIHNTIEVHELDVESEKYTDLNKLFQQIAPEIKSLFRDQIKKHR